MMPGGRFANLKERLLRAGIAPRPLRRLILELETHFDDLVSELRAAGLSEEDSRAQAAARLGTDAALEASILARPELKSWARRRPWAAFALLPLISMPLQFVATMLLTMGAYRFSVGSLGASYEHQGMVPWICRALLDYALWLAPIIAAGLACLLAARRRAPVLWPIIGTLLIACLGAFTNAGFEWSPSAPHGVFTAGIGFPGKGPGVALRLLAPVVLVLVPFLWIARRDLRRDPARAD